MLTATAEKGEGGTVTKPLQPEFVFTALLNRLWKHRVKYFEDYASETQFPSALRQVGRLYIVN
jgi:hypothetical protein